MSGYLITVEADVEAEQIDDDKATEVAEQVEVVLGDWFGFDVKGTEAKVEEL